MSNASPSRVPRSSSTIATRITSAGATTAKLNAGSGDCQAHVHVASGSCSIVSSVPFVSFAIAAQDQAAVLTERDVEHEDGAPAGRRLDRQRAAERRGTSVHVPQ